MWPYSERSSTVGNKMRLLNVQKKKKKTLYSHSPMNKRIPKKIFLNKKKLEEKYKLHEFKTKDFV